ncbi:excinuclease ABC subunit UvrC [Arachidicoccus ginsenosidivorans]|uniref:excinuclease ABC subunit UvrC n=1 Tax=Arachidicoccus ginsenosidivorans TaxID=496057 RepID=UPI001CEF90F3|nr:excinuclease ABC subunit UvrC [Arachidicoccus ginsenosidivorans]
MTSEEFLEIAPTIPKQPGIYKYFDAEGTLIYVGKAKHLRKRVSSYFNKTLSNYKTHELVQRIRHIEFTIVDTEQDAFLLENSLIKQFQPKYNIMLKDDKTYPYIVIKREPFPRIYLTRNKIKDGSEYIGPFTNVWRVREILDLIKENIPLRTCKLNLTKSNIEKGKFKVCLEYHLGNCKGPCEGLQTKEDYDQSIQQIRQIVKGNLAPVVQHFKEEMMAHVNNMAFEKAEIVRRKIADLENYQAKSTIVNAHLGSLDVFSIWKQEEIAYVNFLMVEHGTIIHTHTVELQAQIEESEQDVLLFAMANLREQFNSINKEIVVANPLDYPDDSIKITVPKAGEKKNYWNCPKKTSITSGWNLKRKRPYCLKRKYLQMMKGRLE